MELTNEFTVPVPLERAWAVLLDVEKVAPCMPGATLTSFDGEAFEGNVKVKLGPVNLTYAGKGRFASRDEATHTAVIEASGKDSRGRSTAGATVTTSLHPNGAGTLVKVITDLKVTGPPAQFGRGMIADVSRRLVGQFATCLAERLGEEIPTAETPVGETPAVPSETPAAPSETPAAPAPAESIDLLEVTGFKRYAPYVLVGVGIVVAVVVYLIVR
ncbi:MAG TPA: SRPBCC domain-containing protein [Candidatus Limnocylindrales bacterium]|nr:SRPBCC domain-containing protein [Candidatus Limnocylindrales bacterium]